MKSRVSVEPTQLNDAQDGWVEAEIWVEREPGYGDPEYMDQTLTLTPTELRAVYDRLKTYYEQGIWSFGTVEGENPV